MPPELVVLVLTDRGLWSPRLWRKIRVLGWHPLLRVRPDATFAPLGQCRRQAQTLIPGPGHAWLGRGVAFKHARTQRVGTLLVVWADGQAEPWLVLTDLPPERVGVAWYGLRVWIELGFRALKGVGWQWEHTRRHAPERIARHWLVLAVATLWVLAYGTRAEDAMEQGGVPAQLHRPPPVRVAHPRPVSVFRLGVAWLQRHLQGRGWWRQLWLLPEAWPEPRVALAVIYHDSS